MIALFKNTLFSRLNLGNSGQMALLAPFHAYRRMVVSYLCSQLILMSSIEEDIGAVCISEKYLLHAQ